MLSVEKSVALMAPNPVMLLFYDPQETIRQVERKVLSEYWMIYLWFRQQKNFIIFWDGQFI